MDSESRGPGLDPQSGQCVVSLSKIPLVPSVHVLVNTESMTGKLLTGALNLITNKQNIT